MRIDDYDLLAVDLDGTVLDRAHRIPEANRAALQQVHNRGLRIVFCTGRTLAETWPIGRPEGLGFRLSGVVTAGGALVCEVVPDGDSGVCLETIARVGVPRDTALSLTRWFQALGYAVLWFIDANQRGVDGYILDGPRRHPAVDRWREASPNTIVDVAELPPDVDEPLRVSIVDDRDALAEVAAGMIREFRGRLTYNLLDAPAYNLTVVETFAPQVDKWFAIKMLCDRWGIDVSRTIAIGDDVNDVALVREAGLGVAMGNAHPHVRDVADRITGTNDACGVAQFLNQLLEPQEEVPG